MNRVVSMEAIHGILEIRITNEAFSVLLDYRLWWLVHVVEILGRKLAYTIHLACI